MSLTKLQFRPGINRETTSYSNEGGWYDCDKIRFRSGVPEKIGGWEKLSTNTYQGTVRGLKEFVALDGTQFMGVGTNLKYYVEEGGAFNDITPLRSTTSAGDVTFAAVNGSAVITAADTSHGAIQGDFVTFSGAASLGGNITAAVLNQEYEITEIVNDNSYKFTATATANSSDSGNGGGSTVGKYQINVGLDTTVSGSGWGAGTWGRSTWGSASSLLAAGATLRLWSHDNFGEDLLINVRDGGIYYWDKSTSSGSPFTRAVALSTVSGADSTTPTIAKIVLVSDVDRHIVAFGCDAENSVGTQDPLLIRFSSQGSLTTWQTEASNTAGSIKLGSGSEIISAVETKRGILVFTDVSLHAMQFIGPPYTFGVTQVSENITIMGPNVVKAADDAVYWMGQRDFYMYNGQVQKLPCTVKSYVFNDFNVAQSQKFFCGLNSSFNEVIWFYCSSSSDEIDRYVTFNYTDGTWVYGTLARTAWVDRGIEPYPIAAGTDSYLYYHELGLDDGSTSPSSAINSYIESSQLSLGEGERFVSVSHVIPDITFDGSDRSDPNALFTLKTRNYPGGAYLQTESDAVTQSAPASSTVVEQFTSEYNVRLRGRSFALKVSSSSTQTQWRLGTPRVEIRPDGRR
tara:strand:+ start:2301 stop:4184 length:1884 start_codon:yes stop_codon:yes gene_type:complete